MVDRFEDLQLGDHFNDTPLNPSNSSNSSNTSNTLTGSGNDMTLLLTPIKKYDGNMKKQLDSINDNIKNISVLIDKSLMSINDHNKIKKQMDDLISEIDSDMRKAKKIIEQMNAEKKAKANASHTVRKIIDNIITNNVKRFSDTSVFYVKTKEKYETKTKEKVKRQLIIVDKDKYENISDDQLQQIMESKQNNVFTMDIYNDIRQQNTQIMELEKSVIELAQLFQDMQLMVNQQGIIIDSIEDNITKTDIHIEKAVSELEDANKYQVKSRKKTCCIIICITMIVAIIITVAMIMAK